MNLEIPADGRILYYARDRAQFEFLSNFYPRPIRIGPIIYPSVEHFYQSQKANDKVYFQSILDAPTPRDAKRLGAEVSQGRSTVSLRPDWKVVKILVMRRAIRAKFTEHHDLREALLATGSAELIEDSPTDEFWGIGAHGLGQNWAGRILMDFRDRLKTANGVS